MNGGDTVPASAPVRAWRYWQLSPRRRLRSVAQKHVEWPADRSLQARCIGGGHPAPAASCSCGISGARDLETLRQHGLCVAPGGLVVGKVDLWGRVVTEPYGYRAEHGRVASIGLVEESIEDEDARRLAVEGLAAYGVPVTVVPLDEAVAGVTAATLAFQVMSGRASRTFER